MDASVSHGLLQPGPPTTEVRGLGGHRIPVRTFGAGAGGRPVVLLHGLQSHSGWFVQSAERLAELGLPVFAFDRRGSGASDAAPDPGPALEGLLEEIDAVADHALAGSVHDTVHLAGHCFGAIPALLYAGLHRPDRMASLVLATPALHTHTDLPIADKLRVLWSVLTRRPARVPVPLSAEELSELEPFVAFARQDPLALSETSARFFFEVLRARRRLGRAVRGLRAPLFVAMAGEDPICDNDRTRRLLEGATVPKEIRVYPGARHILEFSGQRESFLDDLSAWMARREAA